ncbi:MAG: hypothetical protein D6E12_13265 [Desulfovibrio sp.]|nr:MAG: hypothetical protein D6E12_13265 [Desulfovibrio sp.]
MGFFLGYHNPYTALVDKAGLAYRLTKAEHARLERDNPDLARDFLRLVVQLQGRDFVKSATRSQRN